jgi:hypothetical protein
MTSVDISMLFISIDRSRIVTGSAAMQLNVMSTLADFSFYHWKAESVGHKPTSYHIYCRATAFTAGYQKEEHIQPIENEEYERAEEKTDFGWSENNEYRWKAANRNWKTAGVTLAAIQLQKLIGKHLVQVT